MYLLAYVIHLLIYWGYSLWWYFLSNTETKHTFDHQKAMQVARYALTTQLTVLPALCFVYINLYEIRLPETTSLSELLKFPIMSVWEDVLFYHIHRLFHNPKYYKYHKLHHSWKHPVPWGALYASPTENILANFIPVLSAPLVVSLSSFYLPLWIFMATFSSVYAHNGNGKHERHHKTYKNNYGTLGLCDWIYGTAD